MEPRRIANLAQLPDAELFAQVSEGLALIHENATRLWASVPVLGAQGHFRAALILKGVALEEAAKYLILLDAVRCPRKPDGKRFALQLRKFGQHLARVLYAEVCDWRPVDMKEVLMHIERECREYYLDGPNGVDWIFRNDLLRQREETLYVDYVASDEGHAWVSPQRYEEVSASIYFSYQPSTLRLIDALHTAGFGKAAALEVIAQMWRPLTFEPGSTWRDLRALVVQTIRDLDALKLLEALDSDGYGTIADRWTFPLYDSPMTIIEVDKESLRGAQQGWCPDV